MIGPPAHVVWYSASVRPTSTAIVISPGKRRLACELPETADLFVGGELVRIYTASPPACRAARDDGRARQSCGLNAGVDPADRLADNTGATPADRRPLSGKLAKLEGT
jgi:hypothetical protein